ncbi:hypothetical protein GBA52_019981 [Prunus armeniaca]|nr:hypothetical protein GBA52_019981 [Prunus armeniaca]
MVGPVINQDASDRTRGTADHVTYVKFEALSTQSDEESDEEFRVLAGEQSQNPPNQNNRNQHMDDIRIKVDISYFNGHLHIVDFLVLLVEVEHAF